MKHNDPSGKSLTIYDQLDEIQQDTEPLVEAETALQLFQAVYRNTTLHLSLRMSAARHAIPFEAPKPAVTAHVEGLGDRLEAEILRQRIERTARMLGTDQPARMIEADQTPSTFKRRI
jgi:hypothetical protein